MKILNDLLANLQHPDTPVRQVCSGAFWTAVTSRFTGLSSTVRDLDLQHSDKPCMVAQAGKLTDLSAGKLARYALSEDTVSASLGMAALNSLIEIDESRCIPENAYEIVMRRGAGKNVGVVGHFPFIPQLRKSARNVWVLEQRIRPGDLPADAAAEILPKCDVVCLTSTSLVNHTIEKLLELCSNSYVVLTGPTSPMTPLLFDYGIDAIGGSMVTDPDSVIHYISQAATFRQVKRHGIRLLTLTRETA